MPTYVYQCTKCAILFEEFHSMSETVESCKECGSSVNRIISNNFFISKKTTSGKGEPGSLVKKYIEDVRREVKEEKKNLTTKDYVAND